MAANVARWVFLAVGTVLAVLALSPQDWTANLGDWTNLIQSNQSFLMALLVLVLVALLVVARQPFVARLEYLAQSEYLGVPDMAPQGVQSRVVGILDRLSQAERGVHIARVTFLTGQSTLNYLLQLIDKHSTRSNWEIRVLILDPDSPDVMRLGESAREEILASCARLASVKGRIVSRARPATISWRSFPQLPMIRGFLIDDDHLFFGYFEWQCLDGAWELHEQNKRLVYARRGDALSMDSIEFFKSWFDYRWETGRNLEESYREN